MLSELVRRGNSDMLLITGTFAFTECNKTMLASMQQPRSNPKKLGTGSLMSVLSVTGLQSKLNLKLNLSKCDEACLIC